MKRHRLLAAAALLPFAALFLLANHGPCFPHRGSTGPVVGVTEAPTPTDHGPTHTPTHAPSDSPPASPSPSVAPTPTPAPCGATVDPTDPYYQRFEGIGFMNTCDRDEDCMVGGCSGEVCAAEGVFTTCEVLPYLPTGSCGCVNNECVWNDCR